MVASLTQISKYIDMFLFIKMISDVLLLLKQV